DILGAEDAFGDMDFKVAGTREFVTALQLDTKLSGISADLLAGALTQAKDARLQILDVMRQAIAEPRPEMNPSAPKVLVEYIPADKIGEVIGPKGKIIREITDETGANIDVEDADGRGVVHIYSADGVKAQMALDRIRAIANPVVPKEGERYYGTVVKTVDFGAFVSLSPGSDGLLHISKLGGSKRLEHADEAVTVGDKMWVEVREVKDGRKFSLDIVEGGPEQQASPAAAPAAAPAPAPAGAQGVPASADTTGTGAAERPARERRERSGGSGDESAPRSRERGSGSDEPAGTEDESGDLRRRRRRRR
ncbi:MAG: KH domain-containing protein, partial [Egibacteraceae bacterium]